MNEITLCVERDEDSGWLVASWDAPGGGGISTQGRDLRDLEANVREAVRCHFDLGQAPRAVRLHCQLKKKMQTARWRNSLPA